MGDGLRDSLDPGDHHPDGSYYGAGAGDGPDGLSDAAAHTTRRGIRRESRRAPRATTD